MMIYRQLGKRRGVRGAMSFACAPLFALLVGAQSELVSAGEFDRSTLPAAASDPAQCDSQGEGLKDFRRLQAHQRLYRGGRAVGDR